MAGVAPPGHRAERYGHWLVPLVFVAIGVVIVAESGVLSRLI
ncbi:hypothetical protein [Pseudosporangium ferrugineum]|nr:hypothetical protein [Pseudosporangium ferrugineum]